MSTIPFVPFDSRKNVALNIASILIYFVAVLIASLIAVFGSSLATEPLLQFGGVTFQIPASIVAFAIFILLGLAGVVYIFLDKVFLKKGISIWHDPEKGLLTKIPNRQFVRIISNPIFLALILIVFFSPLLYYLNVVQKSALISAPEYSFLDVPAKVFFAGEPTVLGETMFQVFLYGISWAIAFKVSGGNFAVLYLVLFFLIVVCAGIMTIYHLARYSGQEPKLFSVFVFFWMTFFLAFLFGSVLVFIIPHDISNWLWGAKGVLSADLTFFLAIAVYAVVLFAFAYFLIFYLSKRRSSA